MAVTIKDIAKAANVSHTTVSRALRGHPAIASATVVRIQKLADELGYIPNTVARGLKTNRSGVLGVIVRRITDPFNAEILKGIEDVLQTADYSLFLSTSNLDLEREREIVRIMSQRRVDGVIIVSSRVGEQHRRQLNKFGVASVLINNWATEDLNYSISHDDSYGSRKLTEHLISLGHRHIAFLGNTRSERATKDRLEGCLMECEQAGVIIPPEFIVNGPNGLPEGGKIGAEKLLGLEKRPSAIICYNDLMAIGAMQTLQQAGLSVPSDCSVTGFDNIDLSGYINPPLTTFDQPKYELGTRAAQMMLHLLESNSHSETLPPEQNMLTLQGELCVRNSTAPPKQ